MRNIFTGILSLMVITLFALDTTAQKRRQVYAGSANGGVWKTNGVRRNVSDGTSNTVIRNRKDGTSNTAMSITADPSDRSGNTFRSRQKGAQNHRNISIGPSRRETVDALNRGRGAQSASVGPEIHGNGVKRTSKNPVQGNFIGTDKAGFYIDDIIIGARQTTYNRIGHR